MRIDHRPLALGLTCLTLLLASFSPASAAEPIEPLMRLAAKLKLQIVEQGPASPWKLVVENLGSAPAAVVMDRGLLWFEVVPPNERKSARCVLPSPLRPRHARKRAIRTIESGQRKTRKLDPRLYCFTDRNQKLLVPGARVTPHFGWPAPTRKSRGRAESAARDWGTAEPPFVAWLTAPDAASQRRKSMRAPEPPKAGLKFLSGPTLVLPDSYAAWSSPPGLPSSSSLELAMYAGSDATSARQVTVGVELSNASKQTQRVALRRELIRYDVSGPDGDFTCPATRMGPPGRAAFATLESGRRRRLTTRLIEVCPTGSFSRPGLYSVSAQLRSPFAGQRFGFEAFTGRLATPRPVRVRVRSGQRPFVIARTAVEAPAAPPESGGAPSDAAEPSH